MDRILRVGCPNHLVAEDTRSNFQDYWKYGNHLSIATNIAQVMKTMNKEDRNSFLMVLPAILGRLIPDIRYTPQGMLIKPGTNTRLIWDGSHLLFYYSVAVNMGPYARWVYLYAQWVYFLFDVQWGFFFSGISLEST